MKTRFAVVVTAMIMVTGCARPPATQVATTELTFRNHEPGIVTFDARVRAGDALCWQHGDDGAVTKFSWSNDQMLSLTISEKATILEIASDNGILETVPTVSVSLLERPELTDGKFCVGKYARNFGASQAPEVPLYVFVITRE